MFLFDVQGLRFFRRVPMVRLMDGLFECLLVLRALPERAHMGNGVTFEWRTLAPAWPRKGDSIHLPHLGEQGDSEVWEVKDATWVTARDGMASYFWVAVEAITPDSVGGTFEELCEWLTNFGWVRQA